MNTTDVFDILMYFAYQGCIYLIKNTVKKIEILLQFKITISYVNIL